MGGTATCRAAVEFDPAVIPNVRLSPAGGQCNLVERIVRPQNPEFATN